MMQALRIGFAALVGLLILLALILLTGCAGLVNGKPPLQLERAGATVTVTARISGTLVVASSRIITGVLHPQCERRDTSNGRETGLRCEVTAPPLKFELITAGKVSGQIVRGLLPITPPTPEEPAP